MLARQVFLFVACLLALPAQAQPFPSRTVRIVVPFAAGSVPDVIARGLAARLPASLGQPVLVENRPGAGGTIGAEVVATSAPDGHTLLVHSSEHTFNPYLYASLGYDTLKDFASVTPLAVLPNVLIVSRAKGYRTLGDLVAAAKAQPGALDYASPGSGSSSHLNAERFRMAAGIAAAPVAVKSAADAVAETAAGRIGWSFAPLVYAAPAIKDATVVALAVGTGHRAAMLPDVPTSVEAGVPGSEYAYWIAMFAPARTPREVIDRLRTEVVKALESPEMKERLAALGAEAWTMESAAFDRHVRQDLEANASVARAREIKPN